MGSFFSLNGKLPVVLQAERSECALACLAMVLEYYGHRIDLNTLRGRFPVSQHGMTLKSLISTAAKLDLAARPLRLEPADLHKLVLPAILHWDFDHFVILKAVTPGKLVVHDPASGCRELSFREAGKHFTGVSLELLPAASLRRRDDRQRLRLRDLWNKSSGVVTGIAQLLVLSILLQCFAIALPFYNQILIDDVLVNYNVDLLELLAAGFLILTVFRQFTELLRSHVVLYMGNKLSFQVATSLCRHLLLLPQDYFSRRHMGDIVSRFGSLNNVRDFLCSGVVEIVVDGLMAAGTLVLMFVYDYRLTAIALAAVLAYGLVRLASYRRFHFRNEEWIAERALENTLFMENISAIQGIKLFGREAERLATWQNRHAASINAGVRVQKLGINIRFAHGLLTGVENIFLLMVGAWSVLQGAITIGMLMAFISFKDHFYRSVFSLLDKLFEFRLLDVHLDRLADIAFARPELDPGSTTLPVAGTSRKHSLVLEGIAYRYDPDGSFLFRDVSCEVGPGEKVAIIGPTGCGKSTLLKITASLVRPETGRIILDDRPLTRDNLSVYRSLVSGVMQNDTLLSGSILENITFFDPSPDHDRVLEAARLAMIAEDIARMPMQFNTMVGNMGSALSGGQMQRLLLARALYRQPAILVLDEATSHLDINTEAAVNRSVASLGIPCLMVAHRPETVLQADRIFLLEPGGLMAITRQGYRELLSAGSK